MRTKFDLRFYQKTICHEEAYDIPNDIYFIAGHHGGYHRVHHTAVVHRTHGHSYRGHHKVASHVHLYGFTHRGVGKASTTQNDNNTHESTLKAQDGNIISYLRVYPWALRLYHPEALLYSLRRSRRLYSGAEGWYNLNANG